MTGIFSQMPTGLPAPDTNAGENLIDSSFWTRFKGLEFDDALSLIANSLVGFCFKALIAVLVFYAGRFLIRKIYKGVFSMMTHRHLDPSLTTFVLSLIKMVLYFILIITIIGILGIETSSFIAIFASAGVAIGMALSGTLQNFAGGVLILLLKPYKVGDFIEVQGYSGKVKSIQLFNTVINTVDNKAIIVPNGALSTSSINNYSLEQYRCVVWSVGLSYGTDLTEAKKAIIDILESDDRIVKRYVEDDIAFREQEKIKEETERFHHLEEIERNKPWYVRIFHRAPKAPDARVTGSSAADDLEVVIPQKIERKPFVALKEMGDSAIVFVVRAWTHQSNYWPVFYDINERMYTELQQKGLSFPFPQMDVHLQRVVEKEE